MLEQMMRRKNYRTGLLSIRSKSLDVVGIAKIVIASVLYKRWDKIAKIVRRETVHYFVKDNKLVFVASVL